MARGLSLVAILHVVASLESLRGGEERARGLTCRWSWKTSRISKTSVKLNTTEWNFVMMVRGGGLGSYTTLPFCLPMLYSRLLPPHGIWVSSDDIQHNTDQPGSHGICRPGAGWADCLKRKTWSSLVHDQPFNLLAGHSLTSDCIFDLVEFRISGWWSDQTWTSLVGSMSTFGQQTSSGCRRWDLKWYSWQSFVFKTGEFCQPWKGGGVGPARGFGGVEGTRWQDGDQMLDVSLKLIPKTILSIVVNLGGLPFFHCPVMDIQNIYPTSFVWPGGFAWVFSASLTSCSSPMIHRQDILNWIPPFLVEHDTMPSLCFMLWLKPWCSGVSSGIAHPSHQPNNVPPVVSHLPSNFSPGGKLNLVHHLLESGGKNLTTVNWAKLCSCGGVRRMTENVWRWVVGKMLVDIFWASISLMQVPILECFIV